MPRVPTYDKLKVQSTGLPGVRKGYGPTPQSEGAGVGAAIAQFGQGIATVGIQGYATIQQAQRDRADDIANLQTLDKFNKLDHTLLYDQDRGFLTKQGIDAHAQSAEYVSTYDLEAATIGEGLTTDKQRRYYDQLRVTRGASFAARVDTHATGEYDKYHAEQFKATMVGSINTAIHAADAMRGTKREEWAQGLATIGEQLRQQDDMIAANGARLGMSTQAQQLLRDQTHAKVHVGVVDQLLAQDKVQLANSYFQETRDAIAAGDPDAIDRITAKIGVETRDNQALQTAEEIWAKHAPVDDSGAIEIDKMEAAALAAANGDAKLYRATVDYLRLKAGGVTTARKERLDGTLDTVWTAVAEGASIGQIRATPAFRELTGKGRQQVIDYLVSQAEHVEARANAAESRAASRENRAYTQLLRNERLLELNGWSEVYDYLADPDKLRATGKGEIRAKLPTIGPAHVARLLNEKEQLEKQDQTLQRFTINKQILVSAATDAGLTYAAAPKGKDQKANMARLQVGVNEAIVAASKGGVLPSAEEQEEIAKAVVSRTVRTPGVLWGQNERRWFELDASKADQATVPVDEIRQSDPTALRDYLGYYRKQHPQLANTPDDKLLATYRLNIEHAYALRVLGANDATVKAALEGKK